MWPLGYILGSEYSPLLLEQQHPNFNWRDRFEDLLAFESGKKMISAVSRQKEAVTASRIRNETVNDDIHHVNQALQRIQDYSVLLQKLREVSVRRKDDRLVSKIEDEALPHQKKMSERIIELGNALISGLKSLQNQPASSYKNRVGWIASLISSGAMRGWESAVYDSADGWMAEVYKADGSRDGQIFSEADLATIFKHGRPLDFRSPRWSTYEGSYADFYYPRIYEICPDGEDDPDTEDTCSTIDDIRPSIMSQLTKVQQKKLWNGTIETRVVLKNHFLDGEEQEKTIANDSSKVLEEVEKFHASAKERKRAIEIAIYNLQYRKQQDRLANAEEAEKDGF